MSDEPTREERARRLLAEAEERFMAAHELLQDEVDDLQDTLGESLGSPDTEDRLGRLGDLISAIEVFQGEISDFTLVPETETQS